MDRTFQELKDALCSEPGLVILDFSNPSWSKRTDPKRGWVPSLPNFKKVRCRTWDRGCHVQERCLGGLGRPSLPVGAEEEGMWQPATEELELYSEVLLL